jgi:hypothetical protein
MSFRNALLLLSIFIAVGFGGLFLVKTGLYPVAIVDFNIITVRNLEKDMLAAYHYFQNALLVYGSDPRLIETLQSKQEIKRAALDKLISDLIVYDELKKRLKNEFQPLAERKIQQLIQNNRNIEEAVKKIYGLDLEEFKKIVLQPQAYKEILEGRMFLNGEDFNKWLDKAKTRARVAILIPDLQWSDNQVKLR